MFYRYRQNNSGGSHVFDDERGISCEVWVEADSEEHARERALEIGLYENDGRDCPCCGPRWSFGCPDTQHEAPTSVCSYSAWAPEGVGEGYVHFLDGRVEPLPFEKMEL